MATRYSLKDAKPMHISAQTEKETRAKAGGSNSGEYTHVNSNNFAGNACGLPGSYPIDTIERARSALAYAHNARDPQCIKNQVYKKWPSLKPEGAR
jgi:hypothetical protein